MGKSRIYFNLHFKTASTRVIVPAAKSAFWVFAVSPFLINYFGFWKIYINHSGQKLRMAQLF
jgi:hypothetical protein